MFVLEKHILKRTKILLKSIIKDSSQPCYKQYLKIDKLIY